MPDTNPEIIRSTLTTSQMRRESTFLTPEEASRQLIARIKSGALDLNKNPELVFAATLNLELEEGTTPLMAAVQTGNTESVLALLRAGARLHDRSLDEAIFAQHTEIFFLLLAAGARLKFEATVYSSSYQALLAAVARNDLDPVKLREANAASAVTKLLIMAVRFGNRPVISALLEAGPRGLVNYADNDNTPLLMAIATQNLPVINLLLEAGASLEKKGTRNLTPLLAAVRTGKLEIVQALWQTKRPWRSNWADDGGETPIMAAIRMRSLPIVEFLMTQACDVAANPKNLRTPLFLAAQLGCVDILNVLLSAESIRETLHHVDTEGVTPLRAALQAKQVATASALLAAGGRDPDMDTVMSLLMAAAKADTALLELFASVELSPQDLNEALLLAITHQNLPMLRFFLAKKGVNVNAVVRDHTPLLAAIATKNISLVKVLLENGALLTVVNNRETPLFAAVRSGDVEILGLLLSHQVVLFWSDPKATNTVNWQDSSWNTPLSEAIRMQRPDIVAMLLKAGANPKQSLESATGTAAISLALRAKQPNLKILTLLLEAGASPNEGLDNPSGLTALTVAIRANQTAVVCLLLDWGASPERSPQAERLINEARRSRTPLDLSVRESATPLLLGVRKRNSTIVASLLAAGAAVDQPGIGGITPLFEAVFRLSLSVVQTLLSGQARLDSDVLHMALLLANCYLNRNVANPHRKLSLAIVAELLLRSSKSVEALREIRPRIVNIHPDTWVAVDETLANRAGSRRRAAIISWSLGFFAAPHPGQAAAASGESRTHKLLSRTGGV